MRRNDHRLIETAVQQRSSRHHVEGVRLADRPDNLRPMGGRVAKRTEETAKHVCVSIVLGLIGSTLQPIHGNDGKTA